jgi:hypothetical protein
MNWKNVVRLISIDVKSGRLIRGQRLRRYRESRLFDYLLYGGACALGIVLGLVVGNVYNVVTDLELKSLLDQGILYLFLSLPTLIFIYSIIFTLMGQMQKAGLKMSIQPPYWLPITWEEHTLASIVANLLGIPLASIILFGSAIVVVSPFLGMVPLAVLTIFALLASTFLASITTEIFRVLQVKLVGAVYKSSGKAAIWVRFIGSMLFLIIFYLVWFAFTSGTGSIAIIKTLAGTQSAVWFIPYVWLGIALASFTSGLFVHTMIFSLASLLFIITLFYIAVKLNVKFGLYEPPAITVSRGTYVPKVGFWGKLGFSSLEAAVMRKDFKAFTRRRELMYVFIMPIVFIIMPLMQFSGALGQPVSTESSFIFFAFILLMPGALMALMLGMTIIGAEGQPVWHFYASPITANSLVKCKYAFLTIFSLAVTSICSVVGILIARPSLPFAVASLIESILLIFALGAVSLGAGIRGADFVEIPRPKMVRPLTALVTMLVGFILALVILAPYALYAFTLRDTPVSIPVSIPLPKIDLHIALTISTVIAVIITYVFYRIALKNARDFLIKAEA